MYRLWLTTAAGKHHHEKDGELDELVQCVKDVQRLECERVLSLFVSLAKQMDAKADEDDSELGLVWTAAAASIRRVCDEASAAT